MYVASNSTKIKPMLVEQHVDIESKEGWWNSTSTINEKRKKNPHWLSSAIFSQRTVVRHPQPGKSKDKMVLVEQRMRVESLRVVAHRALGETRCACHWRLKNVRKPNKEYEKCTVSLPPVSSALHPPPCSHQPPSP
jgi:hypothetical protein